MELNPALDPRSLSVGAEVRLTAPGDGTGHADGDTGSQPAQAAPDGRYRVREGDTAYSIAQRLGISLFELMAENEELDPAELAIGAVLDVPTGDRSAGFTIAPHAGPVGRPVDITAYNLRPHDWVTIGAGPASAEWEPIRQAQVTADGTLATEVRVPDWADPGDRLVFVVDTDRGITLKSRDFQVTARDDKDAGRITLEGRVQDGVECMTLKTPQGTIWSLVSDVADFKPGEYVEVEGTLADASFCMQGEGTVEVHAIRKTTP
jgi:LysM repeat protein